MEPYQHILVALDISNEARQVLQNAIQQVKCFQSRLTLIHVVEPVVVENSYDLITTLPMELETTLVERAEEFLAKLKMELLLDADIRVEIGAIKKVITELIKSQNIDLLVVGSHGRHGLGLLLGSTATSLIHGSLCDVHVARIQE